MSGITPCSRSPSSRFDVSDTMIVHSNPRSADTPYLLVFFNVYDSKPVWFSIDLSRRKRWRLFTEREAPARATVAIPYLVYEAAAAVLVRLLSSDACCTVSVLAYTLLYSTIQCSTVHGPCSTGQLFMRVFITAVCSSGVEPVLSHSDTNYIALLQLRTLRAPSATCSCTSLMFYLNS